MNLFIPSVDNKLLQRRHKQEKLDAGDNFFCKILSKDFTNNILPNEQNIQVNDKDTQIVLVQLFLQ